MKRSLLGGILVGLLLSPTAFGQSITTFVGTSPTSYVLDGQPAPSGAYSLRRLLTSYSTNKLVTLRRASDNATADIGFTSTGAIDTATASVHCNATTCFVTTWYDQSTTLMNLTQATAGNQPAFIFNCLNVYPCIQATTNTQTLTGGTVTPATGVVSFSAVGNRTTGTGPCAWIRENVTNRIAATNVVANSWTITAGAGGTISATAADNTWHAASGVINGASSLINIDGVDAASGTITGSTSGGSLSMLGAATTTCNFLSSVYWDNLAISAATRSALAANQKAWWGF